MVGIGACPVVFNHFRAYSTLFPFSTTSLVGGLCGRDQTITDETTGIEGTDN